MPNNGYFISVFEDFELGGGPTYFARLANWFRNYGYSPVLLKREGFNTDKKAIELMNRNNISVVEFHYKNFKLHLSDNNLARDIVNSDSKVICVVYTLERYLFLHSLFLGKKCEFEIYFDVIFWGRGIGKFDFALSRYFRRITLEPIICDGHFACMDYETREICANYMRIPEDTVPVVMLGNEIKSHIFCESKFDGDDFNILSVCRMTFPFKGYVFGLVDDFSKLCAVHDNLKLTLIGDGDGMAALKEKVDSLDVSTRNKIELLGEVPYSDLEAYYLNSNVYVGMGTTLLEAVAAGSISIVASSYQLENYSPGFFGDIVSLGAPISGRFSKYCDCQKYKKYNFFNLIEEVYNCSADEYKSKQLHAYDVYKNNYSMDSTSYFLKKKESHKGNVFSSAIQKLYLLKYIVRR